jgi:hypothetical protein
MSDIIPMNGDGHVPEKLATTTTNISARVPMETKQELKDAAKALGTNENQIIVRLVTWFLEHKTFPDEAPAVMPSMSIADELAQVTVLLLATRNKTNLSTEKAAALVREVYLSGALKKAVCHD